MKIVDLWLAIVKQLSEEEKCLAFFFFFCGHYMVKAASMISVTLAVQWVPYPSVQWLCSTVWYCHPGDAHWQLSLNFRYSKYYLLSLFLRKTRLLLPSVSSDSAAALELCAFPVASQELVGDWGPAGRGEDGLSCYIKK